MAKCSWCGVGEASVVVFDERLVLLCESCFYRYLDYVGELDARYVVIGEEGWLERLVGEANGRIEACEARLGRCLEGVGGPGVRARARG